MVPAPIWLLLNWTFYLCVTQKIGLSAWKILCCGIPHWVNSPVHKNIFAWFNHGSKYLNQKTRNCLHSTHLQMHAIHCHFAQLQCIFLRRCSSSWQFSSACPQTSAVERQLHPFFVNVVSFYSCRFETYKAWHLSLFLMSAALVSTPSLWASTTHKPLRSVSHGRKRAPCQSMSSYSLQAAASPPFDTRINLCEPISQYADRQFPAKCL